MKLKLLVVFILISHCSYSQIVLPNSGTKNNNVIKMTADDTPKEVTKSGSFLIDLSGKIRIPSREQELDVSAGYAITLKYLKENEKVLFLTEDEKIEKEINASGWDLRLKKFEERFYFAEEYNKILNQENENKAKADNINKQREVEANMRKAFEDQFRNITDHFVLIPSASFDYSKQQIDMPSFEMSAYEITKSQYQFFRNHLDEKKKVKVSIKSIIIDPDPRIANPKVERIDVDWTSNETNTITNPDDHPDHPVSFVTWDEANAFCEWLSQIDTDYNYRLPYDYEWDYAASAGFTTTYPWPSTINHNEISQYGNFADIELKQNINYSKTGVYELWHDSAPFKSNIGDYKPNDMGLYDMGGNVAEWTAIKDTDKGTSHEIKGGSFFSKHTAAKVEKHGKSNFFSSDKRHYGIGFRMVRVGRN